MEILRINAKEYEQIFNHPQHVFNSVTFSELNKDKCDELHYLVFKESKIKLGIILGQRDGELRSPLSAPYGGFTSNKAVDIAFYENAVECLKHYGNELKMPIRITLVPSSFDPTHYSKSYFALQRGGANILYTDLNFEYRVEKFTNYEENLERSARKNFHNSKKVDFVFEQLDSSKESDVTRAYDVIRRNRESRGFPLRMSLQAILDTIKVVPADFFIMTYEGVDVAAAQVFHVADDICRVIYWGDITEYAHLRVMNFFTYKIFEHYYNKGIRLLDIGISTENGIPNYGLCDFKENIGCDVSLQFSFIIE